MQQTEVKDDTAKPASKASNRNEGQLDTVRATCKMIDGHCMTMSILGMGIDFIGSGLKEKSPEDFYNLKRSLKEYVGAMEEQLPTFKKYLETMT